MKNKKQFLLFIAIFISSIIFTISSITISHGLDSYCTMCNGYKETAIWFLQNGRIFSYLFYMLFDLINLSYDFLRIISVIISNIILTTTILLMYNQIKKNHQLKNIYNHIFLIIILFLIYYSPLISSILVLDEAFIINLGIFFITLSSIYILKYSFKNYFLSLLFAILGFSCYQGLSSYLFISLLILILSKDEYRNNIKLYSKKFILTISIYGLSFITNLIIIKLVGFITKENISKIGKFSIIDNIKIIITNLIPKAFKYFFGYINTKYYYPLILLTLIICILYLIKNKNKLNNLILLILLVLSCTLIPFIPNVFMNTSSNYIEARMALTIGIIPIIIIIYIFLSFKINKKINYILSFISIFFLTISFHSTYQNMSIDQKRYEKDIEYIINVTRNIQVYEKNTNLNIDTIYYGRDNDVAYYYNFGNPTDTNIRIMAIDWALDCALSHALNREINFIKITDEKYNELFKEKEYDSFKEEQLIFDENTLYLLLY